MSRRKLTRDTLFPYHVTARSNNRDWFYLPQQQSWNIFTKYLRVVADRFGIEVLSFVLMSNHFHLMLATPLANIDAVMRYLMTEVSREIGKRTGRINHVFGGRYKWSWLSDPEAVAYVFKYICRNPVKAGITERCEDYPFSTANRSGMKDIPLIERLDSVWRLIPRGKVERSTWLNRPSAREEEDLITKAIRRSHFAFSKDKKVQLRLAPLRASYLDFEV